MAKRKRSDIRLSGLHCADCVATIETTVSSTPGVESARLNFGTAKMEVDYDPDRVTLADIRSRVNGLGYGTPDDGVKEEGIISPANPEFLLTVVSGVFLLAGLVAAFLANDPSVPRIPYPVSFSELFYGIAMVSGGYHVLRRAAVALYNRTFVIDSLVIIAAVGAVFIDAFAEGAAVLFLFSVAELAEEYSVERSRRSMRELADLSPKTASVRRNGVFSETPVTDIMPGDVVRVRSGERIGVDGVVLNGSSTVNQSPITGESMPVSKGVGDTVFAGTINQEGRLEIETTRNSGDTTLARIIKMVESAEERKSPTERFIDRFARYYTPLVVVMAVGVTAVPVLLFGQPFAVWFYKALLLLLIACPCALALSTPIAMVSGITSGARNGVLFKGGAYLEKLVEMDTFAFDKTGTLTEGRPAVTDIVPLNGCSPEDILAVASSLESLSRHPLGKAIIERAGGAGAEREVSDFAAVPGKGVRGSIDGVAYAAGGRGLFDASLLEPFEDVITDLESRARTVVLVGSDRELLGVIGISDRVRSGARKMVSDLRASGVKRIVMLTGDNEGTARAVAESLGMDEYHANLLPEEKVSLVEKLSGEGGVVMVGDGVNDAPALVAADLGVAMGAAGSDTALEVADIALLNDDLSRLPYLLKLGKSTMRVVKQNIVLSIGVKLLFAVLVFPGLVTLWMAVAIGDMGVSLGVIFNALRLSRVR